MLNAHWLAQTLVQWLLTKAKQCGTPKLCHVEIITAEFSLVVCITLHKIWHFRNSNRDSVREEWYWGH